MKTASKLTSELLKQRKAAVLRRWQDLVFETYAPDTAAVLKTGGDRFDNPVSYTVSCNLQLILDGLVERKHVETLFPCLEEIIKIRAVQEFTPETAVCFMPILKKALMLETGLEAEVELAGRIDRLSAACLVIYQECRNRIERIRTNEKIKAARSMSRFMSLPGEE